MRCRLFGLVRDHLELQPHPHELHDVDEVLFRLLFESFELQACRRTRERLFEGPSEAHELSGAPLSAVASLHIEIQLFREEPVLGGKVVFHFVEALLELLGELRVPLWT